MTEHRGLRPPELVTGEHALSRSQSNGADVAGSPPSSLAGDRWDTRMVEAIEAGGFGFVLLDHGGSVLSTNRPVCELLRRDQRALTGCRVADLAHPDDRGSMTAELGLLLAGARQRVRQEVRMLTGDDGVVWTELNVRRLQAGRGESASAVALLDGVADRRVRESELQRLADTDPLTGLLNRRRFSSELERHLVWAGRYGARGALLVLDIDNLKAINDTHGHLAGDNAIVGTAKLLRERARASDFVARVGGDEFAVLLPAVGEQEAGFVASVLLNATHDERRPDARQQVSLSVGVAMVNGAVLDAQGLFERADTAMHEIKRSGGNGYAITNGHSLQRIQREARPHTLPSGPGRPPVLRLVAAAAEPTATVDVKRVLQTVSELGGASPELVAWELDLDTNALTPVWLAAVREDLLRRTRYDPTDDEWTFDLTAAGAARLFALERNDPGWPA